MSERPTIEYHLWHDSAGIIRGVGHLALDAPRHLRAVPTVPEGSDLSVIAVSLPAVDEYAEFDRALVRDGRLHLDARGPSAAD